MTAEEEANKKEENKLPTLPENIEIPTDNNGTDNDADAKAGCFGSVAETLVVISIALAFTLVLILKNKKRMDI